MRPCHFRPAMGQIFGCDPPVVPKVEVTTPQAGYLGG